MNWGEIHEMCVMSAGPGRSRRQGGSIVIAVDSKSERQPSMQPSSGSRRRHRVGTSELYRCRFDGGVFVAGHVHDVAAA